MGGALQGLTRAYNTSHDLNSFAARLHLFSHSGAFEQSVGHRLNTAPLLPHSSGVWHLNCPRCIRTCACAEHVAMTVRVCLILFTPGGVVEAANTGNHCAPCAATSLLPESVVPMHSQAACCANCATCSACELCRLWGCRLL
jgi:hypothetical protein